jgi:hypothetical protein
MSPRVTRWGDRAYAEPSETSSAFYWLVYRVLQALRYEGEPLFDEEEGKEGEEVGRAGSRLASGLRVLAGAECVQSSCSIGDWRRTNFPPSSLSLLLLPIPVVPELVPRDTLLQLALSPIRCLALPPSPSLAPLLSPT